MVSRGQSAGCSKGASKCRWWWWWWWSEGGNVLASSLRPSMSSEDGGVKEHAMGEERGLVDGKKEQPAGNEGARCGMWGAWEDQGG